MLIVLNFRTIWTSAKEKQQKKNIRQKVEENYFYLVEGLTSENSDYRAIGAQALGFSDNPKSLGALVHALNDSSPKVSINAGNSLIRLGYPDVPLEPIEKMLTSSNYQIRLVAVEILGRLQNLKGIPLLTQHIKDKNIEVSLQSVRSLGQIKKEQIIDPLLQHALFDQSDEIRIEAATALGQIPSKKSIAPLIESLRDPNLGVQQAAWYSLQKLTQRTFHLQYEVWKEWYQEETRPKSD